MWLINAEAAAGASLSLPLALRVWAASREQSRWKWLPRVAMICEGSCLLVIANQSGLQTAAAVSLASTGPQRIRGGLSKLQLLRTEKGREAGLAELASPSAGVSLDQFRLLPAWGIQWGQCGLLAAVLFVEVT